MTTETLLETAVTHLQPYSTDLDKPQDNLWHVTIAADDLLPAIAALQSAAWGYLAAITGMDLGPEDGRIAILYHFCEETAVFGLKVFVGRETAVLPSVCGLIPSASFYERELSEMLGITIPDTPDPTRLFLPDEWPEGVYPLRKDYARSED